MERLTNQYMETHKSHCCGCHACYNACPVNAIQMEEDEEGFLYPHIDEKKCIQCGRCARVCRIIQQQKSKGSVKAVYACMNRNLEERLASSSGGVFIRLADYVIAQGGHVFGAAFDKELHVHHEEASDINACRRFMGSKYVQSTIGHTFSGVKKDLDMGELVLFTGTPCQIQGLKLFLGKPYDNLFTVDVICHGVPSPMVFRQYCNDLSEDGSNKIVSVRFRDKSSGWKKFSVMYEFKDGDKKFVSHQESSYMRGFLSNLYMRPCCHTCINKGDNYFSDITLGDYWGANEKDPDMDDDQGTSVVLIRTETGRHLFEAVVDGFKNKPVSLNFVIQQNPSLERADPKHKNREKFFMMYRKHTKAVKKVIDICRESRWTRFRHKIKRAFRR